MDGAAQQAADALTRLDDALVELAGMPLGTLPDERVAELVTACTGAGDRLARVTARLAGEGERRQLGAADGSRHFAHWWARQTRLTRAEAGRRAALSRGLAEPLSEPIASALDDGELRVEQAEVILRVLADLPADLEDPAVRVKVRDHLLDLAARHDAKELRLLGKRALEVIDPETFEADEQRRLEAEEARAAATARITFTHDGRGRVLGRFQLPVLHGELLRSQLLALADPRRGENGRRGEEDRRGVEPEPGPGPAITPERMGWALMELVESLPATGLPSHAASTIALTVTLDLDQLRTGLGVAALDSGHRISAAEARRLACRAGLVPAVLGGRSQLLDLGRTARLFSAAQFRALAVRDKGCTAEGCGLPTRVCHAHHDAAWSRGGPTDLANGRLLCPHHHRLIHNPAYDHRLRPDGMLTFHRRT